MPSNRRCGYCRQYGHVASKCQTKQTLITDIRKHVGIQRRDLSELLVKNGYGIGALIQAYCYQVGEEIPCLVTQESLDSLSNLRVVEYYNVKYSKACSARFYDYTGNGVRSDDSHAGYYNKPELYITVMPMQTGIHEFHALIHASDIPIGPNNNPYRSNTKSKWEHYSTLLAPSNDGFISEAALKKPYQMAERLGGGSIVPLFT